MNCFWAIIFLTVSSLTKQELYRFSQTLLIAEDNGMGAMLMEVLMESFEIEFDVVSNGELALEAVKNKNYALVLMDNQMPKLS